MAYDVKIREGGSWEFIELLRIEESRSNTLSLELSKCIHFLNNVWF